MTVPEMQAQLAVLEAELAKLQASQTVNISDEMYAELKNYIGKPDCTLNKSVPPEVGCAEAVSFLLSKVGIDTGPEGIAGTASLLNFFVTNPAHFTEVQKPQKAAIVVSASGTGNGKLSNGHTGVFGAFGVQFPDDWGIISNDSQTGLLLEHWNWDKWVQYYQGVGGMKPRIFVVN